MGDEHQSDTLHNHFTAEEIDYVAAVLEHALRETQWAQARSSRWRWRWRRGRVLVSVTLCGLRRDQRRCVEVGHRWHSRCQQDRPQWAT